MGVIQQNNGTFNGTSFNATFGSATSSSNLVIIFIIGNTIINTPSGFTSRVPNVQDMGLYVFDKAGGTNTYALTCSAGQGMWYIAEIAGGVYNNGAFQYAISPGSTYNTANVTPTAGDVVLIAGIGGATTGAVTRTVSGWTNSFVEQADACVAIADYPSGGIATRTVTANGSTAYSTTTTYSTSPTTRASTLVAYSTTTSPANGNFFKLF